MKRSNLVPFNLQFFAEPAEDEGAGGQTGQQAGGNGGIRNGQLQQNAPAFDYDKLANIISGKQTVTEDTVLKNYFKQQGLSQDEMNSAISAFKAEKAKNTPDANALQNQLSIANKALLESRINNQATLEAMSLGLDAKSIPYVIKLADMSNAVDANGNVVKDNDTVIKRQVISEETSATMREILKGVVEGQPDSNCYIKGYSIGGKSGIAFSFSSIISTPITMWPMSCPSSV